MPTNTGGNEGGAGGKGFQEQVALAAGTLLGWWTRKAAVPFASLKTCFLLAANLVSCTLRLSTASGTCGHSSQCAVWRARDQ